MTLIKYYTRVITLHVAYPGLIQKQTKNIQFIYCRYYTRVYTEILQVYKVTQVLYKGVYLA